MKNLLHFFFNFNITKVLIILHTKFQSNIPRHFGEMDLNARVDVIIKGRRKFSNGLCEQIPLQIFCFILISINIKIYLYFIQNFSQSYLAVLEKKAILLVLLLLVIDLELAIDPPPPPGGVLYTMIF